MIIEQMLRGELVQVGTPIDGKGPRILIHSTEAEIQSVKHLPLYADVVVVDADELRELLDAGELADFLAEKIENGTIPYVIQRAGLIRAKSRGELTVKESLIEAMGEEIKRIT